MPYLYVLAAILLRVLPHPWNITPVAAMFLLAGSTFQSKRDSLLVPLAALLISDYAVIHFVYQGRYGWFSPFTWVGFVIIGLIGWTLRKRLTPVRVGAASLAGSVTFFLISNFGVWVRGTMYPMTWSGLAACYVAALPFFRNSVVGDLFYAAIMFGSYFWLRRRTLAPARQS
ncbi:MAG: hypothetical protein HY236_01450 [Acidobacteria bacterium]|nr:hypothetical protein [Acidobacteriota bacterium]